MNRFRLAWWGLTLLTGSVFGVMLWLGNRYLYVGPDLLPPFDARVAGYSPNEAWAYLAAICEEQAQVYMGPVHWLDTVFPPLFGTWIWIALRWLGARRLHWLGPLYVMVDLAENRLVFMMLEAGADNLSDAVARWASAATVAKFAILALAFIALGHAGLRRWGKL
ncbi:MAG: hypothetical protein R3256_10780 [Thalassovita sp.]|nr:hypothetical protein [Thalassovita sp.]